MTRPKKVEGAPRYRRRTATSPEERENQLIAAAVDLAEKQIRQGTVSAQVLTHYIKLATVRERLEREKLERENKLLEARVESLASMQRVEELYNNALNAMRAYSGQPSEEDYDD